MNIHITQPFDDDILIEIEALVSNHRTLEYIIAWGLSQTPPVFFQDSVQQDEFTTDVIIQYNDMLYLVYDVT